MKKLILTFFLISLPILLCAQPVPCDDPPVMTSFCMDACIICDIDGFTGRHEASIVGEAPPGFAGECTMVAHNMQWIAFIAGSENLRVNLAVSNCELNIGLEFGLYRGIDCDNFQRISNCFGGRTSIGPGQSGTIENIEPLVIGQYYYIVMDGGLADNCDWTFTVLDGITKSNPLETSGLMEGNFETCPDLEQLYTINAPEGATEFEWTLDGRNLGINEPTIPVIYDRTGVFTLCVTAFNACEEAPPTCQTIRVTEIAPTFFEEKICVGDNFEVADTILNSTGNFEFHITTANGCDSVVFVDLEAVPSSFTDIGRVNICEGDVLPIAGEDFSTTGIHEKVLSNFLGCDSTISLDLFVVICNIQGQITPTPVACFGEALGSLDFMVTNGTPPFSYSWESLGGAINGNGMVENLNENITVNNLPIGTYLVSIDDGFGNQRILITEITQPPVLATTLQTSNFNDFNISCFAGADGSINIFPEGGTAPYTYVWADGATNQNRGQLSVGDYMVTVTDVMGCRVQAAVLLTAPSALNLMADFIDPNCDGLTTGRVVASNLTGGVAPYFYTLNDEGFSSSPEFDNLSEGTYTIDAEDANGCEVEQTGNLTAPIIPSINLGPDLTIELADEVQINPAFLASVETALWRADTGLSCYDCPMPIAAPVNATTYSVIVSSIDNCTATDSVLIRVLKVRDVFVPNVFSPNQDGLNDILFINAGPEVNNIQSFSIYSRWGEQVFLQENFVPNDIANGWDGRIANESLDSGVFIWQAVIDFIDGEQLIYTGDVALVR